MRKNFKTILKLFALGTVFVLVGCSAEKDFAEENTQQKTGTIMHKKFEQLIQETQFRTAFNKIYKPKKDTNSTASRTIMENQYGFTIANIPANVVTTDSITSYTFLINRPLAQPNIFENLIVSVKQNTEPEAFIIKYEGIAPINSDIPFDFFSFQGTKTLIPITYNATQVASRIDVECKTIKIWVCINHTVYEPGCTGYGLEEEVCTYTTTGGSSSSSSSGSHGGGGGSNGGASTAPVVPCTRNCPDLGTDPCITLAPLMQEPVVTTAIDFLKPKTQGKNEFGYGVTHGWDPTGTNIVFNTEFHAGNSNSVAAIKTGGKIAGGIHNHPINGGAIPSIGDVDWLMHCEQDNYSMNDGTAFTMVVVANPQLQGATITYAVTISDLGALQAQMAADFNLPDVLAIEKIEDKIDFLLKKQAKEFRNAVTSDALEKKFLEYFSNYGINLSKFDPVTNKWNNLKLQNRYNPSFPNATNTVLSEPCN